LTPDTGTFFAVAALRAAGFGAAFFALVTAFGLVAVFFAAAFAGFRARERAGDFAALALFALGLAVAALATRFAGFDAARFAFERAADRRKPFARLLLMGLNLKRLLTLHEQPRNCPQLTTEPGLNQRRQVFAGALRHPFVRPANQSVNKEKS